MLNKLLLKHPRDIGESYGEHAGHAAHIGIRLVLAGLACLVHALLPGLFVRTASRTVGDVQRRMTERAAGAQADEHAVAHPSRQVVVGRAGTR